ncbi:MAG: hypothetical protein AUK47_27730 [Deltaproteobacteria bacterium CG2_30_63_29]|nr:MAG: hypothetical protein AUK47_27730 [Deltaproteobacteria bacterium CG2_30_63_29]PIW00475.1 MAG: NAD-dependent epimerase [Deltaproteobacteria bacterium CG17_big_fil_post_rev_8_21_14_2_50_63_7]PJB35165.1 MAG: NAD-dependent epimerase [Deltaproteobacteria bacterium CG_4_9_14_3_um_filter_63_12]
MKVCVTGASGFLGRHLVRQLIEEDGYEVRALCRYPDDELREMGAELVPGSVLEPNELEYAFEGCEAVFHAAGRVERLPERSHLLYDLHVRGTLAVIDACKKTGVRRLLYASSSGTVGVSEEPRLIDDRAPYAENLCGRWPYYLSKIYAEKAVRKAVEKDELDAVILRPTLLLGPGDVKGSSTGDVVRFMQKGLPVVPSGGMSFVDVRDVAAAFRSALHKGKKGESYLLGSINLNLNDFYHRLARLCDKAPPSFVAPDAASSAGVRLLWALGERLQERVDLDPVTLSMARHFWFIDWTKAMSELGFDPRDPGETLYDTVDWLRHNSMGARRERRSSMEEAPSLGGLWSWREGVGEAGERWARRLGSAARAAAVVASAVGDQVREAGRAAARKVDDTSDRDSNGGGLESLLRATRDLEERLGELESASESAEETELREELMAEIEDANPEQLKAALWAARRARD